MINVNTNKTQYVGLKLANRLGIFDMSGLLTFLVFL